MDSRLWQDSQAQQSVRQAERRGRLQERRDKHTLQRRVAARKVHNIAHTEVHTSPIPMFATGDATDSVLECGCDRLRFHGWGTYDTTSFTYYGQFKEGAVCGRGVMKYKPTNHSQAAVFVGWWDGEDAFLEGTIHSRDGRYCLAAEGDEVTARCECIRTLQHPSPARLLKYVSVRD